ncbi:MAG: DUF998 domain-containing protein [Bacteroidales bacterium]|nr:DUF998 domain-containing protein [Bacteroidales bacterium]
MKTKNLDLKRLSGRTLLIRILLICGILASLLYFTMMMGIKYQGYNLASQTVSELSAIGAPTRNLWILLGFVYQALMIAFGLGVWISAGRKHMLRIVGGLLLFAYGLLGFVWPFASMHQREVLAAGGGTFADILHLILGALTVLSGLLIIGLGAAAFEKRFRLYSIATILVLLVFGFLTGLDGPRIQADLATTYVGIWERINITGFLLWIIVLATLLFQSQKKQDSIKVVMPDQR